MKQSSTFRVKTLLTALTAFIFISSAFGQEAIKKQVESLRASGTEFESIQPFESAELQSAKAFSEMNISTDVLTEATILHPATEAFAELELLRPEFLSLEIPTPNAKDPSITLDLYRKSIFSDDFQIESSDQPGVALSIPDAIFYRGTVQGAEHSLVAITVLDGEMSGLISYGDETYVLGRVKTAVNNEHLLYRNDALNIEQDFVCTALESDDYQIPEKESLDAPKTVKCVRVRAEIDNNLVSSLGGVTAATNYVTSLYNQVVTLYYNDDIDVTLAQIYAWNGSSPYSGDVGNRLYQVTNTYPNIDLTQLLTGGGAGGVAWLSGLCSSTYGVSVAGLDGYFYNIPTYSWDVMVATHELGHNLGSAHTHACAWNGNNTAIDGCGAAVGYSEGCTGPIPSNGGTIMSYCHLTSAGINLSLGFGPQPKVRIQNYINSKGCLTSGCGGGPVTCENNDLTLNIAFDNYPQETSWQITNSASTVVASGGNYTGQSSAAEDICLEDGCYTLTFFDSYGDGMCCSYGNGSFTLNGPGGVLASGSQYTGSIDLPFCLGETSPNCDFINFNDYTISSYAGNRDIGTYTILDGGATLYLQNNALKSIEYNYNVTPNTMVEFEFKSTNKTQVHGFGFDNDLKLSLTRIFKLFGSMNNNKIINDYAAYSGSSYGTFVIPTGSYYSGSSLKNLFFLVAKKVTPGAGNAYFKNVRVYEAGECGSALPSSPLASLNLMEKDGFVLYPNPATETAHLIASGDATIEIIRVYNTSGALVQELTVNGPSAELNLSDRAQGLYIVTWTDSNGDSHQERLVKSN